ncbi:DUF1593 domain-containing protein [Salegentibacter sp. LM13S]|uniref:DUF1593 domain-containing protein n=1 Tax=Salegentibacter lacus TaxID=2873599 RepID=UPI001CCDE464|nr:DUF1593 domain-containing protein [Salegentibacter lacus]MBZ9631670.1 DUF1593 domain-containing protein [Salegentibacter lacus]
MKNFILVFILLFSVQTFFSHNKNDVSHSDELKPRVIILTDISTWETDDSESLVRLFTHADLLEIEAIIYTTGYSLEETRDDFFELIQERIDAYEKDLPNLMKRSNQSGFVDNENQQKIGYWPSAEYLRERSMFGSEKRGIGEIGENNASEGSNKIIELANEDDNRPLWVLLWGGGNTLAQAIWQVQQEGTPEELKTFLHKIPTYAITDQDRSYKEGTPFDTSSQQWIRREFREDLMYLWDECAWKFQNATGKDNWDEYAEHIQGHGNLGELYPKYKFGVEGDTPSFLHVLPNGLNNPLAPGHIGWGGYFEWGLGTDESTYAYINHEGEAKDICEKYEDYFYPATFNNFIARMDWAKKGEGNRNPIIILNEDEGLEPIRIEGKEGESIKLDASESYDLENNELSFKWFMLPEASTYKKDIAISNTTGSKITINIPSDLGDKSIHIICEVTDHGSPKLTSYRRIIINPK